MPDGPHEPPDAPEAAAAPARWRHTAAASLSSGSHVSGADGASRSSDVYPPGRQTAPRTQRTNTMRLKQDLTG